MVRRYKLREPIHVRQAMAALIAMKLEFKDRNLVLYRPLPGHLVPVFSQVLLSIEAGIPFALIPELITVQTHLDSEEEIRHEFTQFKRDYRELSLRLAQSSGLPKPDEARSFVRLLARHPAANSLSVTARQLSGDFARYPIFTLSEYIDSRYLSQIEDADWNCPFWLGRMHESLRIRHLELDHPECDQFSPLVFDEPPRIPFRNLTFLFTGKFNFGTRLACREAVVARGGSWEQNMTRSVDCLVVAGTLRSSNKVRVWQELRRKGWPSLLVSEEQWCAAFNRI